MVFDPKKEFKKQYTASTKRVDLVSIPAQNYIMVDGIGNPTNEEFRLKSEILRLVSREIKKQMAKDNIEIAYGYLEGMWDTYDNEHFDVQRKSDIRFTLMMCQHPNVDESLLDRVKGVLLDSTSNPYLLDVYVQEIPANDSVQMLHKGTYNSEINTTKKIMEYITVENIKLSGLHHEIYLNSAKRVKPECLKTIVRYEIEKA
ncbi:MAG: GyrI-like domain-containing protein [Erysipelotrichaceae bacterium]|nr:GyrI-like domain-containing protein [Erysipelotrichaceae bacterium]MDD3808924.1 GyrI-like domain-containing protein [Erysipelotrichaceae bacterium]